MKQLTAIVLAFLLVAGAVSAQSTKAPVKAAADKETKVTKLVCPVTGEDADETVTYAYKGKTFYFCCDNCITKFKKDPETYIKNSVKAQFEPCDHGEEGESHEGHAHEGQSQDGTSHEGHNHGVESAPAKAQVADDGTVQPSVAVINTGKDLSDQIGNDKCPVMGSAVKKSVTTVTYNGKVYGFCCKGCTAKFAANPEKYLSE